MNVETEGGTPAVTLGHRGPATLEPVPGTPELKVRLHHLDVRALALGLYAGVEKALGEASWASRDDLATEVLKATTDEELALTRPRAVAPRDLPAAAEPHPPGQRGEPEAGRIHERGETIPGETMKPAPEEGTWFAVPLRSRGSAVGLVARTARGGGVILAYFFRNVWDGAPSLDEVRSLKPADAVKVLRVGDLSWSREPGPSSGAFRNGAATSGGLHASSGGTTSRGEHGASSTPTMTPISSNRRLRPATKRTSNETLFWAREPQKPS